MVKHNIKKKVQLLQKTKLRRNTHCNKIFFLMLCSKQKHLVLNICFFVLLTIVG